MDEMTKKISNGKTFAEKKKALQELSAQIQQDVKLGYVPSVNDGLKIIYSDEGHEDLKSFEQWQKEGKRIKKGAKALMLWGSPRTAHNKKTGEEYSYYPVKYVFSDRQVWEEKAEYQTISKVHLVKEDSGVKRTKISSSQSAADVAHELYGEDIHIFESTWAILLDRSNTTVGVAKISQGGISGTVVDIRLVLNYALGALASGIILVHNHPSGALVPSSQDSAITRKLKEAARWMDIILLDHLIVNGSGEYYSFADNGII